VKSLVDLTLWAFGAGRDGWMVWLSGSWLGFDVSGCCLGAWGDADDVEEGWGGGVVGLGRRGCVVSNAECSGVASECNLSGGVVVWDIE